MSTTAIIMLILFIAVIWGGLVVSSVALSRTSDDTSGELGTAPGTDDATLGA
ncbi:methionine/alanine import NSS transporter subunit MetS [Corynebacterium bovis]|uniref:methionine/alanine import NSS transporter subunit MetS n=1 Tax=Corynebacterium bovis TaxID=36808 RepID=UPI00244A5DB7|nr:methionine/alanine import NSS transporter subunit MetS [Corynebacterium bovis]MDH2455351.1 methionine/alanine import NSS transporter subunit MetS [Corynebacterium bovis]